MFVALELVKGANALLESLMIRALGFSQNAFNPRRPGRLCRGRERWITPWNAAKDAPDEEPLIRTVVSGAAFTDDAAADALRGVAHAGVDISSLIVGLFPRKTFLAFMEDGHPEDIPELAENIEAYEAYRAGGRTAFGAVRWTWVLEGVASLRELFGEGPTEERVRGLLVNPLECEDDGPLLDALFLLTGMSCLDSPPSMYQPVAIREVLKHGSALILFHRDKHGPAVTVYTEEEFALGRKLNTLADRANAMLVPFAIPPMLARWDRALSDLRTQWHEERPDEEFPVPPAPEGTRWSRRGQKPTATQPEVVEAAVSTKEAEE